MTANKLEGKARELLAAEVAAMPRTHEACDYQAEYEAAAIRAIRCALDTARQSEGMVPEEVRLAVKMLDIGQSFALCNHAHEDTRRDIKKLRPEIDRIKAWVDSLAAAPADAGEGKV